MNDAPAFPGAANDGITSAVPAAPTGAPAGDEDPEDVNPCGIVKVEPPGKFRRHGGVLTAMLGCGTVAAIEMVAGRGKRHAVHRTLKSGGLSSRASICGVRQRMHAESFYQAARAAARGIQNASMLGAPEVRPGPVSRGEPQSLPGSVTSPLSTGGGDGSVSRVEAPQYSLE